jgi:hypothetical protein
MTADHTQIIVFQGEAPQRMSRFLQPLKEPVAHKGVAYVKAN